MAACNIFGHDLSLVDCTKINIRLIKDTVVVCLARRYDAKRNGVTHVEFT